MVQTLGIIIIICGIVANSSFFVQSYKIIKNKTSANVSIYMYFIIFVSAVIWEYYAYTINDWTIMIVNVSSILGCISVMIPYYIYKEVKK